MIPRVAVYTFYVISRVQYMIPRVAAHTFYVISCVQYMMPRVAVYRFSKAPSYTQTSAKCNNSEIIQIILIVSNYL